MDYLKRKAEPKVLDSIDLQIKPNALSFDEMSKAERGEPSAAIRERVLAVRKIQEERYKDIPMSTATHK